MRPKDLMVGDWVILRDPDTHKETKVTIQWNDLGSIILQWFVPIPITPEILEKNGFITEEREGDPTFPYLAFIIENDEYRVEITWYDSHDVYEPNTGEYLHGAPEVWNMEILGKCSNYDCGKNKLYLHELQHALKLCGINKEIKP